MDALDEYLSEFAGISGYKLADAPDIGSMEATPQQTVLYGLRAMSVAWQALPPEIRSKLRAELGKVTSDVLSQIAEDMDWSVLTDSVEIVPVIGGFIKALITVVTGLVDLSNVMGEHAEDTTRAHAQLYTINRTMPDNTRHKPPFMMTAKNREHDSFYWAGLTDVWGYTNFKPRNGIRYSFEPCLPPLQCEMKMFGVGFCFEPKGHWHKDGGVQVKCGAYGPFIEFGSLADCRTTGVTQEDRNKERDKLFRDCEAFVNPLWWPFWCPTWPSKPLPIVMQFASETEVLIDPNGLLLERQSRLLTSPKDTLSADSVMFRGMSRALVEYMVANAPEMGLASLDKGLKRDGPFLTGKIDAERDANYLQTDDAALFYIDDDGVVRAYDHPSKPDPARWAFRNSDSDRLVSLADVNAVVEMTLAHATVVASLLLDHQLCRALVKDGFHEKMKNRQPRMHAAILASAGRYKTAVSGAGKFGETPSKPAVHRSRASRRRVSTGLRAPEEKKNRLRVVIPVVAAAAVVGAGVAAKLLRG